MCASKGDFFDNATPSGNSWPPASLFASPIFTGQDSYQRHAVTTLRLLAEHIRRYPSAFGLALCAVDFYLSSPREIALVGPDQAQLAALSRVVWQAYLPNRVIASTAVDSADGARLVPLLRDRGLLDGKPTAFVCEHYTCQTPVNEADALARLLGPQSQDAAQLATGSASEATRSFVQMKQSFDEKRPFPLF